MSVVGGIKSDGQTDTQVFFLCILSFLPSMPLQILQKYVPVHVLTSSTYIFLVSHGLKRQGEKLSVTFDGLPDTGSFSWEKVC